MNDIFEVLAYVRATLKKTEINKKITNSKRFYQITRENGLVGLVYNSLKSGVLEEKYFQRLENDFFVYIKKDLEQREALEQIKKVLIENEIKFILLKGSHLKDLYSESYMRGMGDVDILINDFDLGKTKEILKNNNYTLNGHSITHTTYLKNDVQFEIHPGLYSKKESKFHSILLKPFDYITNDVGYEIEFRREFELIYLIYHLSKHFLSGGIGLRSVLDIGVYINYYKDSIDDLLLEQLIDANDISKFVKIIIYLNEYLFDYHFNFSFMKDFEIEENLLLELVNHIATSGIHGVGSNFNDYSARVIAEGKNSKFKFLMRRLFPSVKEMKGYYPVLNKVIILIPLFYLVRLFKVVILRGNVNIKKMLKTTKVKDEKKLKELFEKIDIL